MHECGMPRKIETDGLPDIQGTEPLIKIPIRQVGVENVIVPFMLEARDGGVNKMIANVSMRTNLDANSKGISMSRLHRTLKQFLDQPLKQKLIYVILHDIVNAIGATKGYMRFDFKMPLIRKSPKSENEFPIYHQCRFEGQIDFEEQMPTSDDRISQTKVTFTFYQGAIVQYASYCPCSAELCGHLRENGSIGFPHAQRSFAHILVQSGHQKRLWLEDIIEGVEDAIKTIPYPIIKRVDEQEIARRAAENPIFVEDAIRALSLQIDTMEGVSDWIIKCSHEESIHTSEAIAINFKGIEGGFDNRYYL